MLYPPNLDTHQGYVSQGPLTGLLTTSTPLLVSGWWSPKMPCIPPHLKTHYWGNWVQCLTETGRPNLQCRLKSWATTLTVLFQKHEWTKSFQSVYKEGLLHKVKWNVMQKWNAAHLYNACPWVTYYEDDWLFVISVPIMVFFTQVRKDVYLDIYLDFYRGKNVNILIDVVWKVINITATAVEI